MQCETRDIPLTYFANIVTYLCIEVVGLCDVKLCDQLTCLKVSVDKCV